MIDRNICIIIILSASIFLLTKFKSVENVASSTFLVDSDVKEHDKKSKVDNKTQILWYSYWGNHAFKDSGRFRYCSQRIKDLCHMVSANSGDFLAIACNL